MLTLLHALMIFLSGAAREQLMCDQPHFRPFRAADETQLIVTAMAQTVEAGEGSAPYTYPDWQPPGSREPIVGQVVMVSDVRGAAAELVRRASSRGRGAVLVPWDHDTGCEPIPWTQRSRWIPPGEIGFVAAVLRPRTRWVNGLPTFDVSDAWREPYTVSRMKILTTHMPEAANAIMTPEEYGSFYDALPEVSDWKRDATAAVRRLSAWRKRNPTLAEKYPARWTIDTMLRWAESQRR